jgi:hypothetical protein
MAKELIYVADDFGMSDEINDAIYHTHVSGQLNAAALMMAQPATEAAVGLAHSCPSLQIGWHLHVNDSVPATIDHWPWGASPVRAGFSIGFGAKAYDLMRREVARQWELFQATGLECRFVNSHHHLHAHPFVYRAMVDVVGPGFSGWIRLGKPQGFGTTARSLLWSTLGSTYLERRRRLSPWRATDTLWGLDRIFHMNAGEIEATRAALPDGFHEFLFHPRTRSCPDSLCLLQLKSSPARA